MTNELLKEADKVVKEMELGVFTGEHAFNTKEAIISLIKRLADTVKEQTTRHISDDMVEGWQPIETAPKDGTWVLLTGGTTTEDDYSDLDVELRRPVVAFYDDYEKGWLFCFWDGSWREGYENPTHWMLLPQPPKAALKERSKTNDK